MIVTTYKRDTEVVASNVELPAQNINSMCIPWIKEQLNTIYGPNLASTARTCRVSSDVAIWIMGADRSEYLDPYPYRIDRYVNHDDQGRVAAVLVEDQSLDAMTVIFE